MIWQIRHDFVSLHFLQHIHTRDVGEGRADGFVRDQFLISTNLFTAPLWLAGLYYFFAAPDGKRYRLLGWLYVIRSRSSSSARAAATTWRPRIRCCSPEGASFWDDGSRRSQLFGRAWCEASRSPPLAAGGVAAGAIILPFNPVISANNFALRNNGDLREEIGWTDLVAAVAKCATLCLPKSERTWPS